MHSNLHILCLRRCLARLRLSNQRRSHHSRHSRHHIGRLCSPRNHDSHRIRGSHHRIPGLHRIRGSHRIRGLAARR